MGTSLTGLTPAATYQGLIKFGDNSAISASLRYLSDGLGNDLPISVASSSVGINTLTGSALVNIKGTGSTSSSSSLIVQNSAGTELIKSLDDGTFFIGNSAGGNFRFAQVGNDSYLQKSNYTTGKLIFTGTSVGTMSSVIFDTSKFAINTGTTTATSTLQIKGSGSTSATTSLLVQNSSSTQLLKITDDGVIEAGSSTATQFKVMNTEGLAVSRDASLDANIRIREFAGSGPVFKMNGNSGFVFKFIDGSNFPCILSYRDWTGIGKSTTTENTSAALQTDSTTRGWLPPRMTDAQVRAIATPAVGLTMYNTDLDCPVFYSSAGWRKISHSAM